MWKAALLVALFGVLWCVDWRRDPGRVRERYRVTH